jgi:hypothetical protein
MMAVVTSAVQQLHWQRPDHNQSYLIVAHGVEGSILSPTEQSSLRGKAPL